MTAVARFIAAILAICLPFCAPVAAGASTFTIDFALSGPAFSSGGLVVAADPNPGTVTRDIVVGQSLFFPLFTLWTDERAIGSDDLVQRSIFADFSLPYYGATARLGGTILGHSEFFDIFQWGTVHWDQPLEITFGQGGRLAIMLQNAIFNFGFSQLAPGRTNGADIIATVTLVRQPAAVGLPATFGMALMAICIIGLASRGRSFRLAGRPV